MDYLINNSGTIIVGIVVFIALLLVIKSVFNPKNKGSCSSCGNGCSACSASNNGDCAGTSDTGNKNGQGENASTGLRIIDKVACTTAPSKKEDI